MTVKNISIDSIGLSVRAVNALHRIEVHTVGEMLQYNEEKLMNVRNLGQKSVQEILGKINEYLRMEHVDVSDIDADMEEKTENTEEWLQSEAGKKEILQWLEEKKITIDALELLSAKAYNLLMIHGKEYLYQITFVSAEELKEIPRMDEVCAADIVRRTDNYIRDNAAEIYNEIYKHKNKNTVTLDQMRFMPAYQEMIQEFVSRNDIYIGSADISTRAKNSLQREGYLKLSEIISLSESEIRRMPAMGATSAVQIQQMIQSYLQQHEERILAFCSGDMSVLLDDISIKKEILSLYEKEPFVGFSLKEIYEKTELSAQITLERVKEVIGKLIAEKKLEYVDFRCYRIYESFEAFLSRCDNIDERGRRILQSRLQGITLESIGQELNVTRERVRQIVKKKVNEVRSLYTVRTGDQYFDEDYYLYFFTNYAFDLRDASEWMGIPESVWRYLEMINAKQGDKDLMSALDDHENLEIGLRLKVKNYLNRNKIFIDGMWVEKKRSELEPVIARKFCQEDTSFELYAKAYNDFLIEEEIPFDEDIYYTDAVIRTRKNRLVESRFILWKMNEMLRYYDIDSRDYTELLETLNLDSFENVEYSTMKFMREYPELMEKYDIRDHYELHNLLRKIVPEGSFHDFHCGRMPEIKFGTFDRDAAILDILIDLAPVSVQNLCDYISQEYGYDPLVIQANYLQSFQMYYHEGVYSIDQKVMLADRADALHSKLTDDFYYIDEIRKIYAKMYPDADLEEINPYNLKAMGFIVLSRYVVQNYPSLEAYCEDILTREDIVDLKSLRQRHTYLQNFSQKLMELKRSLDIIEFESGKILNFRKLEKAGITKADLQSFCDEVYDFVQADTYFSISSIKQEGFESELFDLGFSNCFYANLILADSRFSYTNAYGSIILYKGERVITIQSFFIDRVHKHGWIDVYDLMTELEERYDCKVDEKSDITYRLKNTIVYYDSILERFYANTELYYRDLEEGGF